LSVSEGMAHLAVIVAAFACARALGPGWVERSLA
jgi:hypothetical protein